MCQNYPINYTGCRPRHITLVPNMCEDAEKRNRWCSNIINALSGSVRKSGVCGQTATPPVNHCIKRDSGYSTTSGGSR